MLRLRRTLAFSARVHNYLVLLYLFFLGLNGARLWWDTTDTFTIAVVSATSLLATVGILYTVVLIAIACILFLVDRIFPWSDVLASLGRSVVFVLGWVLVSLYTSFTLDGFTIGF